MLVNIIPLVAILVINFSGDPKGLPEKRDVPRIGYPDYYKTQNYVRIDTLYFYDFEPNDSAWILTYPWEIGEVGYPDTVHAYSGIRVLGTALNSPYPDSVNARAEMMDYVHLPQISPRENIYLEFEEWVEIETYDYASVQIYADGHWQVVAEYTGTSEGWKKRKIDLSRFAGKDIVVGFNFKSDAYNSIECAGWLIDNVSIVVYHPEEIRFSVLGVNYSEFPYIYLNIALDSLGNLLPYVSDSQFAVYENGTRAHDVEFFQGGSGVFNKMDIVFMIDNSGSMSDNIEIVRQNVTEFANRIVSAGYDCNFALVIFGSVTNSGEPYLVGGGLTPNINEFISWLSSMGAEGGFEPGWDAIVYALTHIKYRAEALKILVLMTDEDVDGDNVGTYNKAYTLSLLKSNSAILYSFIAINDPAEPYSYEDYGTLAEETGGEYFDINSSFEEMFTNLSNRFSFAYLKYLSPLTDTIFNTRNVVVEFTHGRDVYRDSITYNPANMIKIMPYGALKYALEHQEALMGNRLEFKVEDNAPPYVDKGRIGIRPDGDTTFTGYFLSRDSTDNTLWALELPDSLIAGKKYLDFYVEVSDSYSNAWLPYTGNDFIRVALSSYTPPKIVVFNKDSAVGKLIAIPVLVFSNNGVDSVWGLIKELGDINFNEAGLPFFKTTVRQSIDTVSKWLNVSYDEAEDSILARFTSLGVSLSLDDTVYLSFVNLFPVPGKVITYNFKVNVMDTSGFISYVPVVGWYEITIAAEEFALPYEVYKYAPVLVFENHSLYKPIPVELFWAESDIQKATGCEPFPVLDIPEDFTSWYARKRDSLREVFSSLSAEERYFLRLKRFYLPGHTRSFDVKEPVVYAYYTVYPKTIQYYLFYPFNDFIDFHEGDWERIIIYFDSPADTIPSYVAVSWHYFYNFDSWDDIARMKGTHPLVLIKKGAHSMRLVKINEQVSHPDLGPLRRAVTAVYNAMRDENTTLSDAYTGEELFNAATHLVASFPQANFNTLEAIGRMILNFTSYSNHYIQERARDIIENIIEGDFSPGDTLYSENFGGNDYYKLMPVIDTILFDGESKIQWGAPLQKYVEYWQGNMPVSFAFSKYMFTIYPDNSGFAIFTIGPRGPIRDVTLPFKTVYMANIILPPGYEIENIKELYRYGAVRTTSADTFTLISQIPVDVDLRVVKREDKDASEKTLELELYTGDNFYKQKINLYGDEENVRLTISRSPDNYPEMISVSNNAGGYKVIPYPNPYKLSRGALHLKCMVENPDVPVRIMIYDEAGNKVKELGYHFVNRNEIEAVWDGRNERGIKVAPGVYYYAVKVDKKLYNGIIIVQN